MVAGVKPAAVGIGSSRGGGGGGELGEVAHCGRD